MAVQTQIQHRRGTASSWTSTNPTLAAGEIGFESDTNKFKIGTGSTAWASLPYASNVSPLTTKGDLYTFSTDNARLAAGNNGETLVADSSATTGLRYQEPKAGNPVINSAFQVWQRGTSIAIPATGAATYTADRWQTSGTGANQALTISRQATGDTTNLPFIQFALRYQRNSGQTGTGTINLAQSFESVNSIPFAGKAITLSFYARAGANYSVASSALAVQLSTGTGTDQNVLSGFTGAANPISTSVTLTTTWQRFSLTGTIGTTATQIGLLFNFTPVGTAGAADYFEVTGVQLEVGSVATPFKTQGVTLAGELAACQRYLPAITGRVFGYSYATTASYVNAKFTVPARVAPTGVTLLSTAGTMSLLNSTLVTGAPTAVSFNDATIYSANLAVSTTAGTPTIAAGQGAALETVNGILFTGCEL